MNDHDPTLIDVLTRNACFAADTVAMRHRGTPAEKTRLVIREALEMLIGNGMITVVPQADWPEWIHIDPPYGREHGHVS